MKNSSKMSEELGIRGYQKIVLTMVEMHSKKGSKIRTSQLRLQGENIVPDGVFHIIGSIISLTFDQRLTLKLHVTELKKKCLLTINIMKMLNNKRYGPSSNKLLNI